MNNKAFTLIELTAVIVVLAAIFLVSFPALLNTAKSDENKKYDDMIKSLCIAGESYIYANIDSFKDDSKIEIIVNRLIEYGSVDNNLKNPKTNKSVEDDVLVYTVLNDKSLDCTYKDN